MSRRKKYTIQEVKNIIRKKGGECLETVYKNNKTNMKFKCDNCSNIWTTNFKAINVQNNWCPYCSGRHNNNLQFAQLLAISRGGKCLSIVYKNNKTPMRWKCGTCNRFWSARLDRVKSGTWCPHCRKSWGERAVSKYLDNKDIKYESEYILPECNYQRFDFYIPEYNTAIEYDGIQHFKIHGRYSRTLEELEKRQSMDVKKTIYCLKKNIKLIRIAFIDLEKIDFILDTFLGSDKNLVLTNMEKYEYISKHIINVIFSVLL